MKNMMWVCHLDEYFFCQTFTPCDTITQDQMRISHLRTITKDKAFLLMFSELSQCFYDNL
jgi:hypothetical protein